MFTLRSIFKSADSRPRPATAASGDPSPSPATDPDGRRGVGDGSPRIFCNKCARIGVGQVIARRPDALMVACPRCDTAQWINHPEDVAAEGRPSADAFCYVNALYQIVGGDVPLEGGDSPSLPTTIDRLNKALIEATAIMREQNDQLAAVHAALDQYEADLAARKHGGVAQDRCYWSIRHAVGR